MNRLPDNLPGKKVLVTCSASLAPELLSQLERLGAFPVHIPLIEIGPPSDCFAALDEAIGRLGTFSWAIFTSRNGVEMFFLRLGGKTLPPSLQLASVGPGTAAALSRRGVAVSLVPERYDAEGLLEALSRRVGRGDSLLWPRARDAREILACGLRTLGALVEEVEAYVVAMPKGIDRNGFVRLVEAEQFDAVLFDSPSAVRNFVEIVGREGARRFLAGIQVIPIGPVTAKAIEKEIM